jgi:Response regulator containing CheY-like receiver domain and AraC-type DNA-binding domain
MLKDSTYERNQYLGQLNLEKIHRENILIPEFIDFNQMSDLTDDKFFERKPRRSIYMQKHNRYTPTFTHRHNFFELVYVYSGSALHTLDTETNTIHQGDLCILSPGTSHSLGVFDDSIVINALIRKGTFNDNFFEFLRDYNILSSFFLNNLYAKQQISYITFQTNGDEELQNILLDMFIEHYNEDELSDGILNNLLMIYFSKLLRKYRDSVKLPENRTKKNEKILEILNYIQSNYRTVTLTDISNQYHFAPPYVSALIKENTGQTFSSILQKIRLERASDLLINTNLSISDICEEIGYANPPHFIRLFNQHYQLSPAQYRKKSR